MYFERYQVLGTWRSWICLVATCWEESAVLRQLQSAGLLDCIMGAEVAYYSSFYFIFQAKSFVSYINQINVCSVRDCRCKTFHSTGIRPRECAACSHPLILHGTLLVCCCPCTGRFRFNRWQTTERPGRVAAVESQ